MVSSAAAAHGGDEPRRELAVRDPLEDPAGLEADEQEDGVLQQEGDGPPVDALGDPRLGGLDDRRLVPQQQAGHDDRDDAGGVQLLGEEVRRERRDQRDGGVHERVGDEPAQLGHHEEDPEAERAPPIEAHRKSRPTSSAATPTELAASAVRRVTSAVASLSSDSPSRIVTIRRGSPIRRAIAVAATASGGATTAPTAMASGHEIAGTSQCTTAPTPERREEHQPDREQQDRPPVGVEVDQRRLQRGGVQQRGQEARAAPPRPRGAPPARTAGRSRRPRPGSAAAGRAGRSGRPAPCRRGPRRRGRRGRGRSPPAESGRSTTRRSPRVRGARGPGPTGRLG